MKSYICVFNTICAMSHTANYYHLLKMSRLHTVIKKYGRESKAIFERPSR